MSVIPSLFFLSQQILGSENAVSEAIKETEEILQSGQITDLADLDYLKGELSGIEKKTLP